MASIAYVTDKNMIEFHRLNGSRTMNFWRPGTAKKFTDFHEGDTLFFLVKGTEHPQTREKGILGYGHLKKIQTMTLRQMWNTYGTENGYRTEEELSEAIQRVCKDRKKIPSKINSLYLTGVVFFQAPVYLSEIGIHISNRLESYLYLDKEDPQVVSRLLSQAAKTGMDAWSLAVNDEAEREDFFEEEEIRHMISSIRKRLPFDLTDWEKRKARKWLQENQQRDSRIRLIRGTRVEGYSYEKGRCTLYFPAVSGNTLDMKTQALIGHAFLMRQMLQQECQYQIQIRICFLSDEEVSELSAMLNQG